MQTQTYEEIPLSKIEPSPFNPRKVFEGKKFDDLVSSVQQKGVLEPILVRRLNGNGTFEIVAGERRFRALSLIADANGGRDAHKIPAIVKELSDDEAFEVMTIENLVRADLSEREEAESFKVYLEKKGDDALPDLSSRTGIDARYIRRRIAVLSLPDDILQKWESGEITYGHCEQLLRVTDPEFRTEIIKDIMDYRWNVSQIKNAIDREAIKLSTAFFDRVDCKTCGKNSKVQHQLFELGDNAHARCLSPACFKAKQLVWLQENWADTVCGKKNKTKGCSFGGSISFDDFNIMHGTSPKECKKCTFFISIIRENGEEVYGRCCVGDKSCFKKTMAARDKQQQPGLDPGSSPQEDAAVAAWHGTYYLDVFLRERLPVVVAAEDPAGDKCLRLLLFALCESNHHAACDVFPDHFEDAKLLNVIFAMEPPELLEKLRAMALNIVLQGSTGDGYQTKSRRLLAEHFGVNIGRQWRLTEEYLNKKTIKQLLQLGNDFKVFEQKAAKDFLYEVLMKKRGDFSACKKPELVRVFLESGALDALPPVVPAEILNG